MIARVLVIEARTTRPRAKIFLQTLQEIQTPRRRRRGLEVSAGRPLQRRAQRA